jgi:GDP-L-fucose synthase
MDKKSKIYVAGHRGLVGSAIVRRLRAGGYDNLLTATSKELDLAAKVGGILANNDYPADFIYQNLMIEANVIESARQSGVDKLLFLGSTCIYPKLAPQPLKEEYLLTGPLEPTNEWYAVAKIAGIKLCQAYRRQYGCKFISAMPTNLYGPEDNFDLETSHVMPALIRKFHEARVKDEPAVTVWGSGKPLREFLHVDDCAAACLFLMQHYDAEEIVNIGVGTDISITELAGLVKEVVGYQGEIVYDASKPDGAPRKLVDVSRINGLGWQAGITLKEGVRSAYEWFLQHAV